jgi:nucleoside-diphosphate-sugar epimerase
MKIAIIGATGHIGTYLVPRLVQEGHDVVSVSRSRRAPYRDPGIWRFVERVVCDRESEEAAGTFGTRMVSLGAEAVIDLICFTRESAEHLVSKLEGRTGHYLCCGTIWVHGHSEVVPVTEAMPRRPFGDYGVKKAEMESWLLARAARTGFPATILHPGHIVGVGWVPLNPAGNFNPQVFRTLAEGKALCLPNLGMETVHHVHADDVAQAFCRALEHPGAAAGESFHVVSPAAVTLRGYAERTARWFGREAALSYLPWGEWKKTVSAADAAATWDHIAHSPSCSMEKARRLLGYEPRYGSLEAVFESIDWLAARGWNPPDTSAHNPPDTSARKAGD